ncbi:Putative transposase [Propionibacterium freudenreichii]|nr:Putative transposase [Propionibacterium freudenreichii]SCQ50247.1 Putative transposase [Propionibacterium freudenreichii]
MPTASSAGICGHRGRKGDPLYAARRTLSTGADLLNDKQKDRLDTLFADDAHVEVEVTWSVYQRMIAAYRHENRRHGRELMARLIDSISTGVPKALVEITKLGRTLKKRAADVLAYFDRPSTSNGPNGGDQRQARAPARLGAGVPQPDQLHRQIPARDRRVQTPTTPWIRMSP